MSSQPKSSRRKRSDAAVNRSHIFRTAGMSLIAQPPASMTDIAAAASVSRGTLYRHIPTRGDLLHTISDQARRSAADASVDELRPPGELARAAPAPLSVANVLNKVPPHLLGDQIVAEAHRVEGLASAAFELVDLAGTHLRLLAGPPSFPETVSVPLAVGWCAGPTRRAT